MNRRLRDALFIACLAAAFVLLSAAAFALWVLLIRWVN